MHYKKRPKYTLNDILNDNTPTSKGSEKFVSSISNVIRKQRDNDFLDDPVSPRDKEPLSHEDTHRKARFVPELPMLQNANAALVVDTNFMLTHLDIVEELRELAEEYKQVIIVPWIVVQELDGLKSSTRKNYDSISSADDTAAPETIGFLARKATAWIYQAFAQRDSRVVGQKLTQRIDKNLKGDDSILDCCLYFQEEYLLLTVILSNDRNMCNKSLVHNIKTVTYTKTLTAKQISEMVQAEVPEWQHQINIQQIKLAEKLKAKEQELEYIKKYVTGDAVEQDENMIDLPQLISPSFKEKEKVEEVEVEEMDQDDPPLPPLPPILTSTSYFKTQSAQAHALLIPLQKDLSLVLTPYSGGDLSSLRNLITSRILEEISPVIYKILTMSLPDPAICRALEISHLSKLVTSTPPTAPDSKSSQPFKDSHSQQANNPNGPKYFKTIAVVIIVLNTFYESVFEKYIGHVLKSKDQIPQQQKKIISLSSSHRRATAAASTPRTASSILVSPTSPISTKYQDPGELVLRSSLTRTQVITKKIDQCDRFIKFIDLWIPIWKALEIGYLKSQSSSDQNNNYSNFLATEIVNYITDVYNLLKESVLFLKRYLENQIDY